MCSQEEYQEQIQKKKEPEPLSEMKLPSEEEMAKLRQLIKKEEEFQKLEKAKEQMRINKLKKNKPKKLKPMPKKNYSQEASEDVKNYIPKDLSKLNQQPIQQPIQKEKEKEPQKEPT